MRRLSHIAVLRESATSHNAKRLRSNLTDAEQRLWYYVRGNRFQGLKFRRQVPLGRYVVDFLCEKRCLIVEIDGGQHADRAAQDAERTIWLVGEGYKLLRFWNNDVLVNIDGVLQTIEGELSDDME